MFCLSVIIYLKSVGRSHATQQAQMEGLSEEERKGAEKGAETRT